VEREGGPSIKGTRGHRQLLEASLKAGFCRLVFPVSNAIKGYRPSALIKALEHNRASRDNGSRIIPVMRFRFSAFSRSHARARRCFSADPVSRQRIDRQRVRAARSADYCYPKYELSLRARARAGRSRKRISETADS